MTFSSLRWTRGTFGRAPFSATGRTLTPIDVKVPTYATSHESVYRRSDAHRARRPRPAPGPVHGLCGGAAAAGCQRPVYPVRGPSVPGGARPRYVREPLRQLAGDVARAQDGGLLRLRAQLRLLQRV